MLKIAAISTYGRGDIVTEKNVVMKLIDEILPYVTDEQAQQLSKIFMYPNSTKEYTLYRFLAKQKSTQIMIELLRVKNFLDESHLRYIILKGVSLSEILYNDPLSA